MTHTLNLDRNIMELLRKILVNQCPSLAELTLGKGCALMASLAALF